MCLKTWSGVSFRLDDAIVDHAFGLMIYTITYSLYLISSPQTQNNYSLSPKLELRDATHNHRRE
jgi:hypothetical protein